MLFDNRAVIKTRIFTSVFYSSANGLLAQFFWLC